MRGEVSTFIRDKMASTVASTTFSTFKQSASAHAVPRSMSRNEMPFLTPTLVSESDSGFSAADGKLRLIVDREVSGKEGAEALKAKYLESMGPETDDGKQGEKVAENAEDAENAENGDEPATVADADAFNHCDVIVWIPKGDADEAFTRVESLRGDTVFVVVCDDSATEMSMIDLLASLARAIVTPFSAHASRDEWKKARHPSMNVVSKWSPDEGAYDVPVSRRIATIVEGANRRLDAMYATVFSRKIVSSARTAVSRWGKKAGVPLAKEAKKSAKTASKPENKASAAGTSTASSTATP